MDADTESLLLNTNHDDELITSTPLKILPKYDSSKQELALLDLYSGCGGMSTGLCLGAKLASVNLVTVMLNHCLPTYSFGFHLTFFLLSISLFNIPSIFPEMGC